MHGLHGWIFVGCRKVPVRYRQYAINRYRIKILVQLPIQNTTFLYDKIRIFPTAFFWISEYEPKRDHVSNRVTGSFLDKKIFCGREIKFTLTSISEMRHVGMSCIRLD